MTVIRATESLHWWHPEHGWISSSEPFSPCLLAASSGINTLNCTMHLSLHGVSLVIHLLYLHANGHWWPLSALLSHSRWRKRNMVEFLRLSPQTYLLPDVLHCFALPFVLPVCLQLTRAQLCRLWWLCIQSCWITVVTNHRMPLSEPLLLFPHLHSLSHLLSLI